MKLTVIFPANIFQWFVAAGIVLTVSLICTESYASEPLQKVLEAIDEGRNYEAMKLLSQYRPSEKELPRYYYLKGRALEGAKRHRKAIGYLNRAYITAKDTTLREDALFERGVAYLMSGFHYEAASNFRLFINLYPESTLIQKAYLNYAQASLKTGNYVEALAYFRKVSNTPEAIFGKAEVFQRLGLFSAAHELYNTGLISYNNYIEKHPDVLYHYAENLRVIGKTKQAKSLFYLLMNTYLRERAYLGLGLIEYARNNMESAEMYLKKASESPDRVIRRQALLNLGRTLISIDQKDRAIEYLKTLQRDYAYTPESEKALLLLAGLMRKRKDYLQAEKYLREILFGRKPLKAALNELDTLVNESIKNDTSAFRDIWNNSGQWLYEPSREDTLLNVAEALRNSGGDFIRVYTYLTENGSKTIRAKSLSQLAIFFSRLSDVERVEELVTNLEKLNRGSDEILRARAWLYYLKEKKSRAFSEITRISHPVNDDIDLLWRVKEGAPSVMTFIKNYKTMSRAAGVPLKYTETGRLLTDKGMRQKAIKYFNLALKVNPNNAQAMFMLARLNANAPLIKRLSEKKGIYGSMAKVMIKEQEIKKHILEM
ncbi:MAG: tetratricopeptide repeat protein [Nitrospirae bacterium]|nr:tetratricopeptide repeat protein [Nitrospirota bacterium]